MYTRDRDAQLYEVDKQSVPERLLPLSAGLVYLVRNMGMQNILRVTCIHRGHAECVLCKSVETD